MTEIIEITEMTEITEITEITEMIEITEITGMTEITEITGITNSQLDLFILNSLVYVLNTFNEYPYIRTNFTKTNYRFDFKSDGYKFIKVLRNLYSIRPQNKQRNTLILLIIDEIINAPDYVKPLKLRLKGHHHSFSISILPPDGCLNIFGYLSLFGALTTFIANKPIEYIISPLFVSEIESYEKLLKYINKIQLLKNKELKN